MLIQFRKRLNDWIDRIRASVIVISYPKSGRTWLRVMIGKGICCHHNLDDQLIFDEHHLVRALRDRHAVPVYTHDGSSNTEGCHYDRLNPDKSAYRGKKVIFMYRNPRDVVVSCYFQASRRKDIFQGNIGEFIRDPHYGIRKILTFYNIWAASSKVPKDFLLLDYTDLHQDPTTSLRKVLEFSGIEDVPFPVIQKAVEFSSFESMKKMEKGKYFKSKKLRPGDKDDPESYKVRKGTEGGYRNYLDTEDCQYLEQMIAEMGCGFEGKT